MENLRANRLLVTILCILATVVVMYPTSTWLIVLRVGIVYAWFICDTQILAIIEDRHLDLGKPLNFLFTGVAVAFTFVIIYTAYVIGGVFWPTILIAALAGALGIRTFFLQYLV